MNWKWIHNMLTLLLSLSITVLWVSQNWSSMILTSTSLSLLSRLTWLRVTFPDTCWNRRLLWLDLLSRLRGLKLDKTAEIQSAKKLTTPTRLTGRAGKVLKGLSGKFWKWSKDGEICICKKRTSCKSGLLYRKLLLWLGSLRRALMITTISWDLVSFIILTF